MPGTGGVPGDAVTLRAENARLRMLLEDKDEQIAALRRELPANWDNVSVTAWAGLTVEFCRQHGADVIIRGVRNRSDLPHEYQLAAMNESLGIATLLLPANPRLAAVSSTILRGLSI
jgi:pantetheine-phosphate adenylyltransferase